LDPEEGAWSLTSGRSHGRGDETNGGDASWRSEKSCGPLDHFHEFGNREVGVQDKSLVAPRPDSRNGKQKLKQIVERLCGEVRNVVSRWISQICENLKPECILAFRSSGVVMTI
jgi:hypothetical protein